MDTHWNYLLLGAHRSNDGVRGVDLFYETGPRRTGKTITITGLRQLQVILADCFG